MGYKVNPPSTEELRQLAVRRLGVSAAHDGAALTGEQAKQLLEEVAISKVEVEIQNVYLQDTCARLACGTGTWVPTCCSTRTSSRSCMAVRRSN